MPIKRNDTYEYREVVKRPDLSVTLLEIGTCKEDVLFEQLKKPVNGRFYHTEDTNRFFFDFKGKRFELNLIGGGGGEPIDLREYAKKKDIPTKLSQLRNDSDFVTITTVGTFLKQHDYITEDDLIESISDFVKKKDIDEINKKINNLNVDFTGGNAISDSKGNIKFSFKQDKGKVSYIGVDVSYATVTKINGDGSRDTTLKVADGDGEKLVIGSDVSKISDFTNRRICEELGKLNVEIFSFSSEDEPITVSVSQKNGLLDTVDVITLTANLSFNNDTIKVQNKNGIVIGSDINELKKYIDSKVVSGTLTYIKNLNGDKDAIKLVETNVDGKLVYDINMIWSDFYNND
jgi:hypothetical protein